jgi:hypothetical protein
MLATSLAAIAALAATGVQAAPPGGPGGATTHLTLQFTDNPDGEDLFSGTVTSSEPICEVGRQISLYRKKRKNVTRVATDHSSPSGFEIGKEDPKNGKYFVETRRIGNCDESKSAKIKVKDDKAI